MSQQNGLGYSSYLNSAHSNPNGNPNTGWSSLTNGIYGAFTTVSNVTSSVSTYVQAQNKYYLPNSGPSSTYTSAYGSSSTATGTGTSAAPTLAAVASTTAVSATGLPLVVNKYATKKATKNVTFAPQSSSHALLYPQPTSINLNPHSNYSFIQANGTPAPSRKPASTTPPRVPSAMTTTAAPPTPPDWDKSCEAAIQSLTPFIKIPVNKTTKEFGVLSELVHSSPTVSVTIKQIERVVNLTLWKKFVAVRKELLNSKSDDLSLLSAMGLTDWELQQQAHIFLNFEHDKEIPSYADNVALLFHCTRGSVDTILSQGLDERLGKDSGLLGRGIYFADDPAKSMGYDGHSTFIVCAVFLGDCVESTARNVREPEKTNKQKRNPSDLFFDSIVGNPTSSANEYVIYNRHQCVPLYLIHYSKHYRSATKTDIAQMYTNARGGLPPFAWNSTNTNTNTDGPIRSPSQANRWPFFAQTIFKLMDKSDTTDPATVSSDHPIVNNPHTEFQLKQLRELGFTDDKSNTLKLIEFGYDLELTLHALLTAATASPDSAPTATAGALPPAPIPANGSTAGPGLSTTTGSSTVVPGPSTSSTAANSNGGPGPSTYPAVTKRNYATLDLIDLTNSPGSPPQPPSIVQSLPAAIDANLAQKKKVKLDNLSAVIDAVATGRAGGDTLNNLYAAPVTGVPQKLKAKLPKPKAKLTSAKTAGAGSSHVYVSAAKFVYQPPTTSFTNTAPVSTTSYPYQSYHLVASSGGNYSSGSSTAVVSTTNLFPATSSSAAATPPAPAWAQENGTEEDDDCPICCVTVSKWASLSCSHKLCTTCHDKLLTSGQSMSGKTHTYIKCPFCNGVSGTELGTCPDGVMTFVNLPNQLPGHEGYGTIAVTYVVNKGKYSLNRTGYLPNSAEGNRVLGLLRSAWDRRLIFSVGTSMTTGESDVLVWNIHHKTGMSGGVQSHAYPDPTYMDRLMNELKQYGIE